MKIVVLEDRSHVDFFLKHFNEADHKNILCFCRDDALNDILAKKGLKCCSYGEYSQGIDAENINRSARITASTWFRDKELSCFLEVEGVNIGDIDWLYFSGNIVWFLVHRMTIDAILKKHHPETVIIFESNRGRKGDRIGVCNVNSLLRDRCFESGIRVEIVKIAYKNNVNTVILQWGKMFFSKIYGSIFLCLHSRRRNSIVLSGTLRHLGDLGEALSHKCELVFYERRFRKAQYFFCRKHKIRYVTDPFFVFPGRIKALCRRFIKYSESVIEHSRQKGILDFFGEKGGSIYDFIFQNFYGRAMDRFHNIRVARMFLKRFSPAAVILDEDHTSVKRILAALCEKYEKSLYVISHGIPNSNYKIPIESGAPGKGYTVVNSQFEKDKYCMLGWDPSKIHVLGTPRYDRISRQKNSQKIRRTQEFGIIYCPDFLCEDKDDKEEFFRKQSNPYITRRNTLALISVIKDIGCALVIKPHYLHEMGAWKELLKVHGSDKIVLLDASEDVCEHLVLNDLLVTTVSTVIVEALILDMDVLSINFTEEMSVHTYGRDGVILEVTNPAQLKETIKKIMQDDDVRAGLRIKRGRHYSYYCGFGDGANCERVVNAIIANGKTLDVEVA